MNITFSEIIELDTEELPKPVSQPEQSQDTIRSKPSEWNNPGEGFLTPDGTGVIGMGDARRLFWQTFGIDVERFEDEYRVRFDEALLSVGLIYVDNADNIQVGMRGDTLSVMQYQALVNYFKQDVRQEGNTTILGLWYDPKTFKLLREETIYQGQVRQFYATPMGGTDVSTTTKGGLPSAVNYQYKAGALNITFDYEWQRFADFVDDVVNERALRAQEQAKRRLKIKEHLENIKLLDYKHYGVLPIIEYENEEWALGTDEMADKAADEAAGDALDQGLFNVDWLQHYIDAAQVAQDYADDYDRYHEDAQRELEKEAEENPDEEGNVKEVTDAEIEAKAEEKQQEHYDDIKNDALGYLQGIYGREGEEIGKAINRYIDRQSVIKAAVDTDRRGHFLSGYDLEEHDLSDIDDIELIDLPEDVIDELGINRRYRYHIYAYRIN